MKENKIVEIKERLAKEEAKLETLLKQKKTIDGKISNVKDEIEKYNNIIKQQTFSELSDVLSVKGITINDVMSAIKNNNLSLLQTIMTNNENSQESKVDNPNSNINNN